MIAGNLVGEGALVFIDWRQILYYRLSLALKVAIITGMTGTETVIQTLLVPLGKCGMAGDEQQRGEKQ
jgi:hypothetical protein